MPVKHITAPGTLKCSANVGLSHPVHRLLQFQSSRPRVFSQPLCDHQALQALICSISFSCFLPEGFSDAQVDPLMHVPPRSEGETAADRAEG